MRNTTTHRFGQALIQIAALIVGVGAAAAVFTILSGQLKVYPLAFIFILVPAAILGIPAYLAIRHANRVSWKSALAAGFVIGAIIPAVLVLPGPAADQASVGGVATVIDGSYTAAGWRQSLLLVGGFGLLGSLGALLFWFAIKALRSDKESTTVAPRPPTWRGVILGMAALAFVGAAVAIPQITRDRTCHNPLRDGGDSIQAVAGFNLNVGPDQWKRAEEIVRTFGTEAGWSIRSDLRPTEDFKWFQMSLCREPGTQISVNGFVSFGTVAIAVSQPQGGESWQEPIAELLKRIEAEWPRSVEFQGPQGQGIARPLWAPAAPDSASARNAPTK